MVFADAQRWQPKKVIRFRDAVTLDHLTVKTNLTVKSSVSAESIPQNGPIDKQIDKYLDQGLLWLPLFKVN
jgi:hypothetical protein